jgi:hypothetical protein
VGSVVGCSVGGAVGWSDAVIGGVGSSDAVDGGGELDEGPSDGGVVGSLVGVAGDSVGAVVGDVSDAQKASMDVEPDAACVSVVNAGPVVVRCCFCQSTQRSVVEGTGCAADVVDVDGSRCCVRTVADVVGVSSGCGVGDGVAVNVRSGSGAPMVRCATSCSGAGRIPV